MYRVITVAREFGSGGGEIARLLAAAIGWRLLDRALVEEIARSAHVETEVAERFDERADPWLHRLGKLSVWGGGIDAVAAPPQPDVFDSEEMARFAAQVIRHAAEIGRCVVVGRGGQCVLAGRPDVFHVFVYASHEDRVRRIRQRNPASADPEALLREADRKRTAYIREYFQQDWYNPHLYDIMINSRPGENAAVETILCASGVKPCR